MRSAFRRARHLLIVLLIVTVGTFLLIDLLPGDPAAALLGETAQPEQIERVRDDLGLDDPLPVRYVRWLGGVVTGDFGESYRTNQPVLTNLANRVPVSLELMVLAQAVALLIAMPLGIYTAYRPGRNFDKTTMAIGFGLVSLAPFILAMLLILLFAGQLNLLPATGFTRWSNDPLGNLRSLILPTMTLALSQVAIYHQLLRSDMIATLQSDHVLMAKSKGLPTWHVLIRHALRPSSFSLLTLTGVNVGRLIGGSVIVEVIFGIPGIGQMLVQSIYNRDFIVLQGALLFVAAAYVLVNMIVDIMYTFLDPRVKVPDDQNPAAKVESVPTDPADRVQEIHPLEDQAAETGARTPRDLGEDALPPAPDDDPAVRRKPLAIAYWLAVGWVVLVLAAAVFADLLPLPDPIESDFTVLAQPPSLDHPLGTDEVGRDILSRSVFGARVSLVVGISSVLLGLVIGGLFGLGAGYLRGRTERVIMTMTDALLALPALVLLLTIAAVLGQSLRNIVLGLAILSIPTFIRLTRASTLVVSQREFVMASRSYGSRAVRVMLREILPNVVPPVAAYSFIIIGVVIVAEGSLSFLGLGVPPPTPSWGGMIAGGRISLTETPHIALSPSLVMFLTVLSFNFIGERLRKKFDVKESSL